MTRPHAPTSRSGIALVAALGMTTLLGLLIAGAVAASALAHRAATARLDQGSLGAAIDAAAMQLMAVGDPFQIAEMAQGSSTTVELSVPASARARVTASITVIGPSVLWVVLDARSLADTTHRRRANLIARFPLGAVIPSAPITGQDSAIISTDATIVADSSCRTMSAPTVRSSDSTTLYATGWQRALMASSTGVWRIAHDTTIGATSYEGILTVDGNLIIDGSAELRGLVIARGRVQVRGGARVTGAAVSQTSGVELSASQIRFSPCLVGRVLRRAASARSVRGRSWAELF